MLLVYFLFNFIMITPYHYTYLNILNGKPENFYKKFENDYWGSSIKELINNTKLNKNSRIVFSSCGNSRLWCEILFKKSWFFQF